MGTQLNVTEWMRGHVGFGATDYAAGEILGKHTSTKFEHEVLIQMMDIDAFTTKPTHSAPMDGKVLWRGTWRPFKGGQFNMLVDSTDDHVKHMFYRIPFTDDDGSAMTMLGHKMLTDDKGLDLPGDITTLYIHIYDRDLPGHDFAKVSGPNPEWPDGAKALGILHIPLRDGINSALSFDAPKASWLAKQQAVWKFVVFYYRGVYALYIRAKLLMPLAVTAVVLAVAGLLLLRR